ncbi:MAG TPA: RodZ domain-containing protein [Arenimonas sp.]|uniref:RodZ domain-containing protein n=1 Tax=Arenimonas sp. TaxID=1872635 RepID=UPI002D7F851D|nr:RodZ domain-containing protein [Arenimonas sp.]HEU0153618.1 RodZ domain-containing protein [Arenimonas sp.]
MTQDVTQEALFQDPIGLRLKQARETQSLSVAQVAQQLKLPVAIVEAMERDDWPRLGAPVYVRSYLGSYLRLVGLPEALAEQAAQTKPTPQLVPMGSRSRMRRVLDRSLRNGVYLLMTAVLVVPVVLVARHYQSGQAPRQLALDTPSTFTPAPPVATPAAPPPAPLADAGPAATPGDLAAVTPAGPAEAAPTAPPAADAGNGPDPVMASLAPSFRRDAQDGLLLSFREESWIEVLDAQGRRVERGLVAGGDVRRYAAGQVARITLGKADAVEVSFAGKPVDLAPYRAADVARFTVSSTGQPAPPGN